MKMESRSTIYSLLKLNRYSLNYLLLKACTNLTIETEMHKVLPIK